MSTLLLRLAGPMQSWGIQSRFTIRDTGLEPSKSGVVGLLCAALGRARHEPVDDLAALKMGVRVDRQGQVKMDFHTAGGGVMRPGEKYGVALADGSGVRAVTSQRYYLADADFLVGMESEDESLLHRLDAALSRPIWPLFLGRKAFVPGTPVRLGIANLTFREALAAFPYQVRSPREKARLLMDLEKGSPRLLRLVLEAEPGATAEVRPDQPISFARRLFGLRYVRTDYLDLTASMIEEEFHVSLPSVA
ncbi:MAG: type I-E CRISPR-associated protein Cas5/CasD [Deltaproteobacteria bacterium]|nr:type I-E CRISPR-associated protein Cas5/CasD [Deltaproteobacteria bacterium]